MPVYKGPNNKGNIIEWKTSTGRNESTVIATEFTSETKRTAIYIVADGFLGLGEGRTLIGYQDPGKSPVLTEEGKKYDTELQKIIVSDQNFRTTIEAQTRYHVTRGLTLFNPDGSVGSSPSATEVDRILGKTNPPARSGDGGGGGGSGGGGGAGDGGGGDGASPEAPEGPTTEEATADVKKENESKTGTRTADKYEDVSYPIGLNPQHQDCIKFTIYEYKPSGLTGFGESDAGVRFVTINQDTGNPEFGQGKNRNRIATITLPIPGGIQDSNTVSWSGSQLNPLEQAIGSLIQEGISGGNVGQEVTTQVQGAQRSTKQIREGIISKFTGDALGKNNVMQREFGSIINPNLELLFNAPELRTFDFSFKLSPRSRDEAIRIKKIIRNFKQAMSVKRSSTSFLLKTPHTFAISYIFKNKRHPYLNRFKECALTRCNVNYTPEGTYMSFDDSEHPSMVSYQLDLTFQELEPLYDDEYGDGYNVIGF